MRNKLILVLALIFGLSLLSSTAVVSARDDAPKSKKSRDKATDKDDQKKADDDEDDDSDKEKSASKNDDDDDDSPKSKKDEAEDSDKSDSEKSFKEKKVKVDPIKRLIEVKIDEFLIPARAINIPLPGRTRTVREMVERF